MNGRVSLVVSILLSLHCDAFGAKLWSTHEAKSSSSSSETGRSSSSVVRGADDTLSRLLVPPVAGEKLAVQPRTSRKRIIFHKPVPFKLVHKSTISSGPIEEDLFRKIEREIQSTGTGNVVGNQISSKEFDGSSNAFQRRTILSPPPKDPSKSLVHFSNDTPVTSSIRGFIATPGQGVHRISGTPMQLLENTYFKGKRFQLKDVSLSSSPPASMTVIPGVVRKFQIQKKGQNLNSNSNLRTTFHEASFDGSNNNIFKRYTQSPPNSFFSNGIRFSRKPRLNSFRQKPKLKIIILSKTPSKDQPKAFWNNLLQLTPRIARSHRLSNSPSNALPHASTSIRHSTPSAFHVQNSFQTPLQSPRQTPSPEGVSQGFFLSPFQNNFDHVTSQMPVTTGEPVTPIDMASGVVGITDQNIGSESSTYIAYDDSELLPTTENGLFII